MSPGMSDAYHVNYELSFKMLDLLWLFLPCVFFLVGLERVRNPDSRKSRAAQRISGFFIIALSLVAGWALFRAVIVDYLHRKTQLKTGQYSVVEGPVEHFVPMPNQGHASESFDVQGVGFSYSTYEITSCFNHTTSHGGPIHEGLQVRIAYVPTGRKYEPNCILRLEIASDGPSRTSPRQ